LLTLLVVPVLYTYLYSFTAMVKAYLGKGAPEPEKQPVG
jgi:hypothetical protein